MDQTVGSSELQQSEDDLQEIHSNNTNNAFQTLLDKIIDCRSKSNAEKHSCKVCALKATTRTEGAI